MRTQTHQTPGPSEKPSRGTHQGRCRRWRRTRTERPTKSRRNNATLCFVDEAALAKDGSATHRLARRANARVLPRLDIGFARAFLPHEFRRFGIPLDKSNARVREGVEQIETSLEHSEATLIGKFHQFEKATSPPGPAQAPRPQFYIAATQTPEAFEYAGHRGHAPMAIPVGNIRPLLHNIATPGARLVTRGTE